MDTMKIAAVGDIHVNRSSAGLHQAWITQAQEMADILLLVGDLTDYGTEEEARILARELSVFRKPILAVLGNHDYETAQPQVVTSVLEESGVKVLDGETCVVNDVGFAGVKGFAGGFGRRALAPWGEPMIKQFVQEGIDEALKLESAMSRLRTRQRVVLLHYAPIHATIEGEPEAIAPFLGSTRLEEVCDRYRATVIFHGHAHSGSPEGRTKTEIPVYNVAMPLMKRIQPDGPPFRIFELPLEVEEPEVQHAGEGASR